MRAFGLAACFFLGGVVCRLLRLLIFLADRVLPGRYDNTSQCRVGGASVAGGGGGGAPRRCNQRRSPQAARRDGFFPVVRT